MQSSGDSDHPDILKLLNLPLNPACVAGVRDALAGLELHWRNVADFPLPDDAAP